MHLTITELASPAPGQAPCEVVEYKGPGHPDSLCDALAENLSIGLTRFYVERFGEVLHHNVDKALLIGGAARPAFGGGELLEPIEIILAGRATRRLRGIEVPVDELAVESSRAWLAQHIRHLDPVRDVRIVPRIREVSSDLGALFSRRGAKREPLANDTSIGVGFAPLDRLERTVVAAQQALLAPATRAAHRELGEDIKILGVRAGDDIELTVACALVGRELRDLADYFAKKTQIRLIVGEAAGSEVTTVVNAADGDDAESVYMTVTGLSAEAGDDGEVGRGNRVNGLITPYRPMSLEAAAGKNPLTHTGKVYNILAYRIAHEIAQSLPAVEEACCYLLSRIGSPVSEPQLAQVAVRMAELGGIPPTVREAIEDVLRTRLRGAGELWRDVLAAS